MLVTCLVEVVRYLLETCFLLCDGMLLVDKGLSCISLGIGKEFMHVVGISFLFHGCSCLNPWRSIRAYTLHQVYHYCEVDKLFAKVARRSKRAYNLLDLPGWICLL
jgi:hypothetical protein